MTAALDDRVRALLAESLALWRIEGEVRREASGALLLDAAGIQFRIVRAPADLPFRWMVMLGDRERGATSIAGLLRAVRGILDPAYRPVRLRIAPLPVVPP